MAACGIRTCARSVFPDFDEEAQRQDRLRRRQLDRHAGQAAGPEGQPGDRRRHHGTTESCTRRSSSASAAPSRAWTRASSIPPALFKGRQGGRGRARPAPASWSTPRSSRRRAGPSPTSWNDLKDPKFKKQLVIPPINNTYGLYTLDDVRPHERRRRVRTSMPGFKVMKEATSIPTCWSTSRRRAR